MGLKWECPADQTCSRWALSYLFDCICSDWDTLSYVLGLISIVCWGVAEIPQIVGHWVNGSPEGISMAFILVWMVGDICNFLGCLITPGVLPTQLWLALLYVVTTVPLVGKQMWTNWITSHPDSPKSSDTEPLLGSRPIRRPSDLEGTYSTDSDLPYSPVNSTQSLPVLSKRGRPTIHVSASLPVQPYSREPGVYHGSMPLLPATRSSPSYSGSWRRLTVANSYSGSVVGSPLLHRGLLFSSLAIVGVTCIALAPSGGMQGLKHAVLSMVRGGNRQLEGKEREDVAESVGLALGWLMACIYLTGRLPQIILNWSRDFVIGVSVPVAVFAFVGNATYLGSLLVRGMEWSKLKPLLPWVIDMTCCLFFDVYMTLHFIIRRVKEGQPILE